MNDLIPEFEERILSEITSMNIYDFPETILPLLREVLSMIKDGELDAVSFRSFFQISLGRYIGRYVGAEPIQPDWSRGPVKCYKNYNRRQDLFGGSGTHETCPDCQELNRFLADPIEKVWRLAAAEPQRKHLDNAVHNQECFVTTDKSHRPFTIIITKHRKSFEEKHRGWKVRAKEIKEHLQDIKGRHRLLRDVLADKYDDIVAVRVDKCVGNVDNALSGRGVGSSRMAQSAGQKRKATVIDLTEGLDDQTVHAVLMGS